MLLSDKKINASVPGESSPSSNLLRARRDERGLAPFHEAEPL